MNINNRQQLLALLAGVAIVLLLGDRVILSPLSRAWKDRGNGLSRSRRISPRENCF